MYLRASGCYYHPGRAAVAVCAKCGVGICRDCAVKDEHGTILCYQCGNENLRKEHKEHKEHQKRLKEAGGRFRKGTEFIVPGIIGLLIVVVLGIIPYYWGITDQFINSMCGRNTSLVFATYSMGAYCLFSAPFSYIALTDLLVPKYDTVSDALSKWCLKVVISLIIGWIIFTFLWIRFVFEKIFSNKYKT